MVVLFRLFSYSPPRVPNETIYSVVGPQRWNYVKPRNSKLLIELLRTNPENLRDPEKKAKYFKNSYKYYNQHVTLIYIENEDDIDYAMSLVRQVYKKFLEL